MRAKNKKRKENGHKIFDNWKLKRGKKKQRQEKIEIIHVPEDR